MAFWFFRVKDNPFGWLVCHMSFIQIEMRENERRDKLLVVLFEETKIVEVITEGIIRSTIENLRPEACLEGMSIIVNHMIYPKQVWCRNTSTRQFTLFVDPL